ncbi:outer membrane protein assembly factor BamE [Taylorella equigenitalis]|uniref:Outer membrane protein assembly factor BamE n=3 Tax=Taylorella equigenitalis TaxID=29575 RepID=A0A654KFI5_TAYEM|nr:outer membrane protein assembly factor BamE [Taylorella equigenitalis]ADU91171.1 Outer membrane lipoprotein SmpA [Taylorella equigenitalis MCE9]AFN36276.1 putative outer membrane protein [Taylorella equigenitalis ATCC 35865]ASY38151.1 outer membrane protein assembly factor BamE [Taylorella equigenitalis]ASY39675.1 outer membrane protein assembly factor BamE [Taylorella equigenitalis]ASY41127.1 outer membrane protein assembly factor BamE [Taylorella equigenitalis]
MQISKINKIAFSLLFASLLVACSGGRWGFPYKAPIQQGNWVTQEQLDLLQKGMTKEQVVFALGNPVSKDIFRTNRWDYRYSFKPGFGSTTIRELSLWFDSNDRLTDWKADPLPHSQPATFKIQQTGGITTETSQATESGTK